jgi:hypothetical protein
MQFDPHVHTKEFLLNNTSVLVSLCQSSRDFHACDLAYDYDILNTEINEKGWKAAHVLATNSEIWLNEKIANDIKILKIKVSNSDKLAHFLAAYQENWLNYSSAHELEILKIKGHMGRTVAHRFAEYQSDWLKHAAVHDKTVLSLKDKLGMSVAHFLAIHQYNWLKCAAVEDYEILKLRDNEGWYVAHLLAQHQSDWCKSKAANDPNLLKLENNNGKAVAFYVVKHFQCLNMDAILSKEILTLENQGKMLAEVLVSNLKIIKSINIPHIALKLISKGAAYKHSDKLQSSDGEMIFEKAKALIDDCSLPEVTIKYAVALYSTIFHNVQKLNIDAKNNVTDYSQCWTDLLKNAELEIKNQVLNNPFLMEMETQADINCEPGDDYLKKICSELNLQKINLISTSEVIESDSLSKPFVY